MSDRAASPPGISGPPDPADAVAALAREVERLRRALDEANVPGVRADVGHLARTVAGMAEQVADLAGAGRDRAAPSWLWPLDPGAAGDVLAGLIEWANRVYVQFGDGRLPACWLWHPDVVEELVWLWHAWLAAYRSPGASPQRAGDWHDRQRPGVARRISAAVGTCSLHAHLEPEPAPRVPTVDAVASIAAWRAEPESSAPVPTGDQLAAADSAYAPASGRWR